MLDTIVITDAPQTEIAVRLDRLRGIARTRLRLHVEAGLELIELRRLLARRDWISYVISQNVGYHSRRSAMRDILLAETLASLPGGIAAIDALDLTTSVSAILEAISSGEETLGRIIEAAGSGVSLRAVDVKALETVAQFSPVLAERVTEGAIGVHAAHAVVAHTERLNCEPVAEVVATHGASAPEAVDTLLFIHERRPELFESLAASGAIYNPITETNVLLKDASTGDLLAAARVEEVEVMARQKAHLDAWRERRTHSRMALMVEDTASAARDLLLERWPEFAPEAKIRILVYEDIEETPA